MKPKFNEYYGVFHAGFDCAFIIIHSFGNAMSDVSFSFRHFEEKRGLFACHPQKTNNLKDYSFSECINVIFPMTYYFFSRLIKTNC
ncbi:MAG: hypothetical protein ACI8RD_003620 [Bacillariaceae sp.]|jgi:hypothetical protein